jgi:hypothetical protein
VHDYEQIERALSAATNGRELTAEERAAVREVLEWWRTWKAWGVLGKAALWAMITAGAVAVAYREVLTWFRD